MLSLSFNHTKIIIKSVNKGKNIVQKDHPKQTHTQYKQLKQIQNRGLRQRKTADTEGKPWQVYCFRNRNVLRLD